MHEDVFHQFCQMSKFPWQNSLTIPLILSNFISPWHFPDSYEPWLRFHDIDGLVQERRNSSALAMELRLSCINPLILFQHDKDRYW